MIWLGTGTTRRANAFITFPGSGPWRPLWSRATTAAERSSGGGVSPLRVSLRELLDAHDQAIEHGARLQ